MTDSFEVRVVNCCRHALVVGRGEIDMSSGSALRDALFAAQKGAPNVMVDLSEVTFMDSTGINALIGAYRRRPVDGSLKVVGAKSPVRKVFEITGLSELLMLEPRPLTWQQVTYHNSGWRQWMTEKRTYYGVPLAEIIELGTHRNRGDDAVEYALEYQGESTLFGSLEEAMRAADLLGSITPHNQIEMPDPIPRAPVARTSGKTPLLTSRAPHRQLSVNGGRGMSTPPSPPVSPGHDSGGSS